MMQEPELRQHRTLIDFVIIGGMKCGTSELYAYLSRHPDLKLSARKEPNFFNDCDYPQYPRGTWERGSTWYNSLFEPGPGLRGEASTLYSKGFFDERVASRIFGVNPRTKLIYLVRHPVDRAISAYLHRVFTGQERQLIHAALLCDNSQYVMGSMYHARIQPFLGRFPGKQVMLVQSEAFWQSPGPHLALIYQWLGVSVPWKIVLHTRARNSAEGRSSNFMRKSLQRPHSSEALRHVAEILARSGFALGSRELAQALGFSTEDRKDLSKRFRRDCSLLETTFPGITAGWRL